MPVEPDATRFRPPEAAADPDATAGRESTPFDRVRAVCRSFTADWNDGRPDLPAYLLQVAEDDQPTLLRNLLEYEVRKRRASGESPQAREYLDALPQHAAVVRRVFLDVSSISLTGSRIPTPTDLPPTADLVASLLGEYRLIRELGRGGMGAVFEAVHTARGHRVALKTLPVVSGDALHRFKREFRSAAGITHPNLVGLHTLESDGGQWFLTMDLVPGVDFRSWVRPGGALDEGRLRAALAQLAAGVMALHARGVVHRDLKPGNVLVTADGRVVILDFGLAAELAGETGSLAKLAGTPAYMAPEQAGGGGVGPPADWYAVGVMVYEGLCGRRPFESDDVWELLRRKQSQDAPPLDAGPADLADLAMSLLARDPAARPDPLAIAGVVSTSVALVVPSGGSPDQLVGRESQFAALAETLNSFQRADGPITAFIKGRSGEGKTSLAEAFLAPLRSDPGWVVLSGRCYDRESVPFKALDVLVDALTTHLRTLTEADATRLLPDDIGLLAHLFPVLNRCEAVEKAPKGRMDALDQQQVRARAFGALRLLLDRLAQRTRVACFVDDLQWGDEDSGKALFDILRPPGGPKVLFLGSYRSDEADDSPFLTEWQEQQRVNAVDFADRAVSVGPLSLDESTQLVVNLLGQDSEVIRRRAVQFHAQTGGNPFLLTELAVCFDPHADAFHATDIHGVLDQKLGQLPAEAGSLLNAVSVSGQALDLGEATAAAGLNDSGDNILTPMRNARLVRLIGSKLDTYHDRIRYAILDRLPEEEKRGLHRRLAEVIERTAGGLTDVEIAELTTTGERADPRELPRVYDLAYHWDAAGERVKALAYGLAAAGQARKQSALDVAAEQYALSERNLTNDVPQVIRFQIARGRGEAFLRSGRYDESKIELDRALSLARRDYETAIAYGLLGEWALSTGKLGECVANLGQALVRLGVNLPRSEAGLWSGIMKQSMIQLLHRCLPWRLHRQQPTLGSELCNSLLTRLMYAYYVTDVLKVVWVSLLGLNRAERFPPSQALAFNYVARANALAAGGRARLADRYYQAAIELSENLNDHWGVGLALVHSGVGSIGAGKYETSLQNSISARELFNRIGDVNELHLSQLTVGLAKSYLGNKAEACNAGRDFFEMVIRTGNWLFDGASFLLWSRGSLGQLPFDEAISCVRVAHDAHLARTCVMYAEGRWHLHHGRTAEALHALEECWKVVRECRIHSIYTMSFFPTLVTALRHHTEALEQQGDPESRNVRRRWYQTAPRANRYSWLFRSEQPHALRELALVYEHKGKLKKAHSLAAKSCRIAEQQKAKYEHAKSLLVQGKLAKKLGRPEADEQIRTAEDAIEAIEAPVRELTAAYRITPS